jgi:hypothetical protein
VVEQGGIPEFFGVFFCNPEIHFGNATQNKIKAEIHFRFDLAPKSRLSSEILNTFAHFLTHTASGTDKTSQRGFVFCENFA